MTLVKHDQIRLLAEAAFNFRQLRSNNDSDACNLFDVYRVLITYQIFRTSCLWDPHLLKEPVTAC